MSGLYEMTLHETIEPNNDKHQFSVTRVPGGWLYAFYDYVPPNTDWRIVNTAFVPFHNEFMELKP